MATVAFNAERYESDPKYRGAYKKFIAHQTPLRKPSAELIASNMLRESAMKIEIALRRINEIQWRQVTVELSNGTTALDIFHKIITPDTIHNEPLVREILDRKRGIARAHEDGTLRVLTKDLDTVHALRNTPGTGRVYLTPSSLESGPRA